MNSRTIIPWEADKNTKYSSEKYFSDLIQTTPAADLAAYVDYVLWECSTEFMVSHGLPTDADVRQWITWMEARPDKYDTTVQEAMRACAEYLK